MRDLPRFIQKLFTLAFAFVIFIIVILFTKGHRAILTQVGVMLMITIVYLEMLMVRDHLWLIEGSLIEARRWRGAFFSKQNMRQQRLRKLIAVILAAIIFTFVFIHTKSEYDLFAFLGTVLMITVLYFEVLTIRDEVFSLSSSLKAHDIAETAKHEAESGSSGNQAADTSAAPAPDAPPMPADPTRTTREVDRRRPDGAGLPDPTGTPPESPAPTEKP
ncbi:MAG TPA: hypothetical protein PLP29_14725 [Candidatus Ozemobacteraceae bacterium]|nr:hypothetical protein [Candidatus Ozemobacteraceae bacterium]